MPKISTKKPASRGKRSTLGHKTKIGKLGVGAASRVTAVMSAAEHSGLLGEKRARIAGRTSRKLIQRAKQQTGIAADTDLIEFALASLALDDNFSETFRKTMGSVDPNLKLGF
ncbi:MULTISPECIES: hypothetical protein [Bradyrhizobium]|uniref:hypothetical protein n=1 Tax=Bradyrhizobium TaxID=374 RepID=UPI000B06D4EB|nr:MULTISPECIES: hypothetical protein [Bradyrhizobium]